MADRQVGGTFAGTAIRCLARKEQSCRTCRTRRRYRNAWTGGQIVAWAATLFLIFLCVAPFLIGGVSLSGLGKLRPPRHCLPLYRGIYLCRFYPDAVPLSGSRAFSWGRRSALRNCAKCGPGAWGTVVLQSLCSGQPVLFCSMKQSILSGWFTAQRWIFCLQFRDFSLVRCSLVLWECAGLWRKFGWRGFLSTVAEAYGELKATFSSARVGHVSSLDSADLSLHESYGRHRDAITSGSSRRRSFRHDL